MRFCHVTTFYPPHNFGGDGILVQQICEGLARRGHQVDVVYCVDAYELKGAPVRQAAADPPGLRRHPLRSGWGLLSPLVTQQTGRPGLKYRKLREILSGTYDVVHFHNISLIGGPGVLQMSNAPVTLYTTHDHWLVCPAHILWKYRSRPCERPQCFSCSIASGIPPQLWRYTDFLQRCLEHVDTIMVPSQFTADKHREAGINRPIQVLNSFSTPLPVEGAAPGNEHGPTEAYQRLARDGGNQPRFVYAGRIERSKGLDDLLLAFRQRPDYELLLAGDGSLSRKLKSAFADCAHIRFLGPLPHHHLAALFQSATAVVSPTWGPESFQLVNIEAMSCGTPVIARRGGGSVETIERTGGGLIYDHPEELPGLLDRIVNEPSLRDALALRAKHGYQQHYSEARWMQQYLGLIDAIAADKA